MAGLADFFNSGAGQRSLLALGSSLLSNSSGPGGLGGGAPTTAQALGQALPGAVDAYDQYGQQQRRQKLQDLQLQQLEGAVGDAEQRRQGIAALRNAVTGSDTSIQANPFSTGQDGQVQGFLQPGQEGALGDMTPAQRAALGAMGGDQLTQLVADRSGLNRNVRQLTGEEARALGFPEGSSLQINTTTGAISPLREGFDEDAYRSRQAINFGYQDQLSANAAARREAAAGGGDRAALELLQSLGASPDQVAGFQLGGQDYRDEILQSLNPQERRSGATGTRDGGASDVELSDAFGALNNLAGAAGGLADYVTNGAFGADWGSGNREAEAVVNSINTDLREAMQPVGARGAVWDRQQANELLPQPGTTGQATARKRYRQIADTYLPRQIANLQEAIDSGELTQSDQGKATQRLLSAQSIQQQLRQLDQSWDGAGGGGQATTGPQPGAVEDGYQFLGGDPADPSNWRQADSGPLTIDINGGR